jgi:hypothetical protein
MFRIHRLGSLAALGLLACCRPAGRALAVRFDELPIEQAPLGLVRVVPIAAGLVVEGTAESGRCHLWVARGAVLSSDTVTIWARERGRLLYQACDDVGLATAFRARIDGLPPGRYVVRVGERACADLPACVTAVVPPAG